MDYDYSLLLQEQLEINLFNIIGEITVDGAISYYFTTILMKITKLNFVKSYKLSRNENKNYILKDLIFEHSNSYYKMEHDNDFLIDIENELFEIKKFIDDIKKNYNG